MDNYNMQEKFADLDLIPLESKDDGQETDMNQPHLRRWASWRQKQKLEAMARKEKRAVAKQAEKEMRANGEITKNSLREDYAWAIIQSAITLGGIAVAVTTPFTIIAFLTGIVVTASAGFSLAYIKEAIQNHKEYRRKNPKVKREKVKKPKKEKGKKLGLGKRIKNFFSKSKNKSDDSNQQPEIKLEEIAPNPIDIDQIFENEPSQTSKDNGVALRYSLDQNSPRINTIDLSNISVKPGLDFDVQQFIVKKDDELMQNLVEQYIEKSTGTPAMYEDKTIDNKEKRVYMLTR